MLDQILARLGILPEPEVDDMEPQAGTGQSRYMTETGKHILVTRPKEIAQLGRVVQIAQDGISIILCLEDAAPEARQRILDFCKGLCAGLDMETMKISNQAYLLSTEKMAVGESTIAGAGCSTEWYHYE